MKDSPDAPEGLPPPSPGPSSVAASIGNRNMVLARSGDSLGVSSEDGDSSGSNSSTSDNNKKDKKRDKKDKKKGKKEKQNPQNISISAPLRTPMHESPGHVFVALTDLRKVSCDAWLVPSGSFLVPGPHWFCTPQGSRAFHDAEFSLKAVPLPREGRPTVRRAKWWPDPGPRPYLINGDVRGDGHGNADVKPAVENVRTGILAAIDDLADSGKPPINRRHKYLIATPLVGTGMAGGRELTGTVIKLMLPMLYELATTKGVDLLLATIEPDCYAAIQHVRTMARWQMQFSRFLNEDLRLKALTLAEQARHGSLTLFLGAGVSMSAGLPSWGGLLTKLAAQAGLTEKEMDDIWSLSFLDQAKLLDKRLGGTDHAMARAICKMLKTHKWSMGHALLAALPVNEVVTTNYDTLFESASRAAGIPLATLPYQPAAGGTKRWLLKMHGCVNHPEDIVLTRSDYIRYESRRAALAGVLQTQLLTKKTLIVGFSLSDDNFHKIADAVRRAMSPQSDIAAAADVKEDGEAMSTGDSGRPVEGCLGTALFLTETPFMKELWHKELDIVNMIDADKPGEEPPPNQTAIAARKLEIFLDFLALSTIERHSHLLDAKFNSVLEPHEVIFRDHLREFLSSFPAEIRGTPAHLALLEALSKTFASPSLQVGSIRTSELPSLRQEDGEQIHEWYLRSLRQADKSTQTNSLRISSYKKL